MPFVHKLIAFVCCTCAMSASVTAQDEWSIDGYVGGVSDYRDRGVSISDKDFAAVASLGAFHESGFYLGVDAGTVDALIGADARTEFFAGYSIDAGDYVYDFSVELDSILGDNSQFYPEAKFSVSRDFGIAYTRLGAAFAPEGRWTNPQNDSFYLFANMEVPVPTLPSITVVSHVGRDMRGGLNDVWDWSVGLSAFVGDIEFTAGYENSSLRDRAANGRLLFGARLYF